MLAKAQTATIWTDKADYHPGQTVTIYGTGFLPNANVIINVTEQAHGTISSFNTTSDSNGNFTATYQIGNVGSPLYTVIATDGTNTATTTFTDTALAVDGSITGSVGPGTSFTLVLPAGSSSNDLVYVVVASYGHVTSISQPSGITQAFAQRANVTFTSTYHVETWWSIRSVTTSVTITVTLSAQHGAGVAFCISGANINNPFDGSAQSATGSSTTPTVNSVTPTYSSDLIIGCLGTNPNPTITKGSAFSTPTNWYVSVGPGDPSAAAEYKVPSGTSAVATGFTLGASDPWGIVADAIAPAPTQITQLITVTMSNSAPSATVTITDSTNPGSLSPSTFSSDGTVHDITMDQGDSFTLSFSNSGSTRDGFSVSSAFSATSSTYTASTTAISVTAYEQLKQTLSYSLVDGGSPGSGPTATGTSLGSSYAPTLTTTATGYWFDYSSSSIAFSTVAGTNEQWAPSPSSVSATSANTQVVSMYNQYKQTLSYLVVDGGSPSAPTLTSTQFGVSYTPALTGSAVGYWLDNGASWAVTNPLGGSGSSERWDSSQTVSGSVSAAQTVAFTYYNQYAITPYYTVSDGSSPTVAGVVGYTSFGGVLAVTPTKGTSGGTAVWADAGSAVTYTSPITSGSERWQVASGDATTHTAIASVSGSTTTSTVEYFDQFQFTPYYTVSDGSSPTVAGVVGYTSFGGVLAVTPTKGTSGGTAVWADAGSAVTYTSPIAGGSGERWQVASGDSGTHTAIASVSSSTTATVEYYHQYQITPYYTLSDSSSPTVTNVVGHTSFGSAATATPTKGTTGGTGVWADAGSAVTYTSPIAGGVGERWQVTSSDSGTYTAIGSVSSSTTSTAEYYHQFKQTLSYSVVDGGSPSAPTASGTEFGLAYVPSLTTSTSPYWFDASGSIAISTSISGSTEQWVPSPASILATQTNSLVVSMYNQFKQTLSYSVVGGGSPSAPTATGLSLGLPYAPTLVLSTPTVYWFDASGSIVFSTSTGGTGERWAPSPASVSATSSNTQIVSMYHQYYLTVTGGNSPTGQGWYNSGSTANLSNAWIWGTSGSTRDALTNWQLDGTNQNPSRSDTGSLTPSVVMSTYHTVNFVSTTQYYLTVNGGNVVTFGTASPTGDQWYDSGGSTTVSSNGVYSRSGGTGQRVASWNLDGGSNTAFSSTGTVTTSSVSMSTYHTVNFNSVTQYQVTFVVSPSGSGSTSPAGTNVWEDTGSLSISTSANSGFSFLSWSSDTVSITFISTSSASTTATISGTGTITANFLGALDHFTFSTISNPQTAGVGFSVTVTAYDAYGNVETGFTGSVSLTESNGGTVTPSSVTISSGGQVTTTVSVSKVGTGVTLGAISGGKTGTSGPFDVTSGALDHFVFNTVGNQVAGSAFSVTITAADSQGNTVTSYTGTPMLSYSAGSVTPFSATGGFTAGVWTGSVTVTVAGGRVSLGVDDGSGHVGTSNLFAVTHASVATSIAVTPNPASVTAGGSQVFAATASDTYGNTWDVTASVTWSINATAGGFWVQSTGTYTAETASAGSPWTVTATLGAVSGTANLTVNPGDLNHFVFDTVGSQVAGSAFSVTITALDSQGNIVTSYGGMPTLSYSVGSVTPFSATGGFTDGVWTGDVTVTVAGASVSLGVDDGSGHTGESNLFDVDPTITASVGSHGSITPSRAIIVSYGANQTFIITPDAHYHVADVLVDNVSVGAVTSYTFYDVTGNHTISASFAIDTFTITVTSAHGSPTASALVNAGDSFNASVTSPESARTGHKWICTGYSIDGEPVVSGTNYLFTNVQSNHTITFEWVEQFYITVISSYGSPTESSQWVAAGSDFTVSVTTPESAGSGHQYVANATSYNIPSVSAAETVTFTWTEQYYLTISGNFGSVSPVSGWYNAGSIVDISASATNSSGERFLWNGWTGTGTISYSGLTNETSVTMNSPVSEAASWTNQYSLTMITNYGTTSPSVGVSWYDAGSSLDVSASAPSAGTGERYVWNGWTGTGSGSYTGTNNPMTGSAVTMNGPINETASWTHQYEVTFVVSLSGSGSTSPAGTNVWEDTGSLGISATANSGYSFSTWSNNTTSITFTAANSADTTATINGSGTITATFTPTTTTTYTVTFTQTGLPAGKSWSVTFNSVTQSSTTSAIVFKSIASGSYSWSVLTPIAGSTGIRYQAYRASGTMSVPSQTTQTITYTISSQLSTTTTSTSSSTTQSTTSSSPTPTPTRSPSPSTTPTASPSPIVEFPNQLLEITLVVSMMIVLSAVVIAQKRKTGKIQSG